MFLAMVNRYDHLEEVHEKQLQLRLQKKDFDDFLKAKLELFLYADKEFIYKNDIKKVWDDYTQRNRHKAPDKP